MSMRGYCVGGGGVLLALLQGCATAPQALPASAPAAAVPLLRLTPKALGCTLAAQQRIEIEAPGGTRRSVDVLLEVDPATLQLALLAAGQTLARLRWDGQLLQQQRAAWAPQELSGERILSELQIAGWPLQAVQQALPAGWQMLTSAGGRELRRGDTVHLRVRYGTQAAQGIWTLENSQQHYRLTIHTLARSAQPLAPEPETLGPACF